MEVVISHAETVQIFSLARKRQADNTTFQRSDYHGAKHRNGELLHIVGALGELATAKALGLPFDHDERGIYASTNDDLQSGLEVRTRGKRWYDRMYIHPKDRPGLIYVHAKLDAPDPLDSGLYRWSNRVVDVVGWIRSEDANCVKTIADFGTPNWTCHESHLQPIDTCPFKQ